METGGIRLGAHLHLDSARRELRCDGAALELKRRAVDVLCVLAEADGAAVTKDELLERVWPGRVVEENNLQVHVSALRKVLERHAAGEVHLMTVPGKGYRLLRAPSANADAVSLSAPDGARGPVVAVLPFDVLDANDEVLARGMLEEISVGLSRVR